MKAIQFTEHGDANVLKLAEVKDPKPGVNEVLIDVKASGLNHLDIWVRMGIPGLNIPLPHIPGSDASGVVLECGDGVEGISKGDRVILSPGMGNPNSYESRSGWDSLCDNYHLLGLQIDGTYCERIVVSKERVIPVSDRYSFEEWASVSLVFLTSWHMLHTHAGLKSTDTVLIHAAGSGVGSSAIQIAKQRGSHVITTVGSDEKADKAKQLGADIVINYKEKDFSEEIKNITEGKGCEVVFEHIGPETWNKNLSCLAKGGVMVTCGATSGPQVEMDLRHLFMKQQTIKGSYMGSYSELLEVLVLLERGDLKPVVDSTFKLEEASEAHLHMESRKNFGKIVLKN